MMTACPLILTTLQEFPHIFKIKKVTFWTALTQKELTIIVNGFFQPQVVHLILPSQLTRPTRPVLTTVIVTGNGSNPNSTVDITFNDTDMITTPTTVTTTTNGVFFANFTVPPSSIGPVPVIATQDGNSASETFNVTSSLAEQVNPMSLPTTLSSPNLSGKVIL